MKTPNKKILVFDTTLRDGEQMPGVVFTPDQKIRLVTLFSDFGIDIIDLMPIVSEQEKQTVKTITSMGLRSEISASCRLIKEDIDETMKCNIKRITLFTPLSDLHLKYKLKITREENIQRALSIIDYAKDHGLKVDFAGEDSTRSDRNYLTNFINQVSDKIEIFFVADTLGCLTPPQTYRLIRHIKENCSCLIGLHTHNDFAQSTANTLEGLRAGADVFSGTFTGIGERAGNAPIEEVCVGLKFLYGRDLGVKYEKITKICELVEKFSNISLQKHKPIVGKNAFTHESGIHADGVIKHPRTYEYFDPQIIGQERKFSFSKLSGKSSVIHMLAKHGESVPIELMTNFMKKIKSLSEQQHRCFTDKDILEIYRGINIEQN